jgi:hypothetical protein
MSTAEAEAERNVRKAPLLASAAPSHPWSVPVKTSWTSEPSLSIVPSFPILILPTTSLVPCPSYHYLHPPCPTVVMSHSPTPPTAEPSEPEVKLYNSRPTLDVPALGEAGRPPPVKFMCVTMLWGDVTAIPREGADARAGQRPHSRARYDTTSAQLPPRDE